MKLLRHLAAWMMGFLLLIWRLTCRYRIINDPRPQLWAAGKPYAYALLHAHQIAGVFISDEKLLAAMVSRSADGDLLVPSLRLRHMIPVRGSSRKKGIDKGGRQALIQIQEINRQGIPILLAVDGPRGPRNIVKRGIADLAIACNSVILPTIVIPNRRIILKRTWDRMQLPQPFSTITMTFGEPIVALANEDPLLLCQRISASLKELEAKYDQQEWARFN
ncbi:MAG: DUF374 domain-containing protein [Deltaproteobacteria bacterium]|nr:DUF374 domain-containing protein [Deltaproteobacteria bacterium]